MSQKYILRFDDLNPYQDKEKWHEIESFLIKNNIKPIIAVVPDNKDEELIFGHYDKNFWLKIKELQSAGWAIALHGYQHILRDCSDSIIKTNNYGEICNLSYHKQCELIKAGLSILGSHGINVDLYCAPAHSFDECTLQALKNNDINTITDGFFLKNGYCKKYNFNFIPQQLWRFRKMPFGIYTICYHHNNMSESDINKFKNDVLLYKNNIISIDELEERDLNFIDRTFSIIWSFLLKLKKYAKCY